MDSSCFISMVISYWRAHYSITMALANGHCVSPPGNPTKGKDLEEDRRDVGKTNLTNTVRVPCGRG